MPTKLMNKDLISIGGLSGLTVGLPVASVPIAISSNGTGSTTITAFLPGGTVPETDQRNLALPPSSQSTADQRHLALPPSPAHSADPYHADR
ncbi:hypothetical protein Dimus_012377 [Dionaea muscipula]